MRSWSPRLAGLAGAPRIWLVLAGAEEVPSGDGWLGRREQEVLAGLRFAPRRADWRLGRWTAKQALSRWRDGGAGASLTDSAALEILAAEDGSPGAWLDGAPLDAALSLSHRAGSGLAAATEPGLLVGCDLEIVEQRSDGFVRDFLRAEEQEAVAARAPHERPLAANLAWCGKECALKALRTGLRLDTREVRVDLAASLGDPDRGSAADADWRRLVAAAPGLDVVGAGWRREGDRLLAWIAATRAALSPAG